jgi:hypothetical protein
MAAVVRHLKGDAGPLPGSIRLPEEIWNTGRLLWPGQDAGWLGSHADPWLVNCDPNAPDFRIPDIALPAELTSERFAQRRDFLSQLNRSLDKMQSSPQLQRWGAWQSKAIDLIRTKETQNAFSIEQESQATRDRYGRNRFGQSVLLARRLVESGVSLVQVNWTRWKDDPDNAPAWDTHAKNAERLKRFLCHRWIKLIRHCWKIFINAECLMTHWWFGSVSSADPPNTIPAEEETIGGMSSAGLWPEEESKVGRSMVHRIDRVPSRSMAVSNLKT